MEYLLIIPGKLDNLNDYISACRSNAYAGAKLKGHNEQIARIAIRKQLKVTINKPVTMQYSWYEPNKRRDLDNVSSFGRKVIQDALVKEGILANDGWREIIGFSDSFYIDKIRPRVEVRIKTNE